MKILVIGGTGTIGTAISKELSSRHDLILAGSKTGDIQVDITSSSSIDAMYKKLSSLDAVVVTVGGLHFGPLETTTEEQFYIGIKSKLMGQINIVLQGQHHLNPQGSFTLTSGILSHDPILSGSNASAVNGAIDSFVKSAALELFRKGQRINVVSPNVVTESMARFSPLFPGVVPVPAAIVARAYAKSVEGAQTGQIYHVG